MPVQHPNKHIREAIKYALQQGWTFTKSHGHAFGAIRCGHGCRHPVYSTPRVPEAHAKDLLRAVRHCPHQAGPAEAEDE